MLFNFRRNTPAIQPSAEPQPQPPTSRGAALPGNIPMKDGSTAPMSMRDLPFSDRLLAAASALQGDYRTPMAMLTDRREMAMKETERQREMAMREAKNRAIQSAYDPETGRFSVGRYLQEAGPAADLADFSALTQAFARKSGVDGGYAYSLDPMTGDVTWGPQRGMSHSEETGRMSAEETGRHNRAQEGISRGQLDVARSNASRGWAAHNARVAAGGYGTPGVGGANGFDISDDEILRALEGN